MRSRLDALLFCTGGAAGVVWRTWSCAQLSCSAGELDTATTVKGAAGTLPTDSRSAATWPGSSRQSQAKSSAQTSELRA